MYIQKGVRGMAVTVKIQKWGNSQGIRIPKNIIDILDWDDNEVVEMSAQGGNLIIKPHKRKTIEELFANYDGTYEKESIDWGDPVGKEIW